MSYASAGFRVKSRWVLTLIIVNALWRSCHSGMKGRKDALTSPLFRIFLLGRLGAQLGVALILQIHQIHRIRGYELGLFNQGPPLRYCRGVPAIVLAQARGDRLLCRRHFLDPGARKLRL